MSLVGKSEFNVQIKAPASKFHEMFHKKPHHISNASGDKVHGCELHEGEWGKVGSIIYWNYSQDGKSKVSKQVIEGVDEEKNLITFRIIEGDLLEHYRTFKYTIQAIPKGEGSVVYWTLEYEKRHENIEDSQSLLKLCFDVSKDIDTHLMGTDN
ncbi:MLP-like protein 43 [Benincasa hispida]|uniref:MLP-like protein 43 n=1 Tax=Benincasa hispida TaxID=102211 RepID=UPI0019020637|nr:MLP-like protein 43 [Benincasa hispida]